MNRRVVVTGLGALTPLGADSNSSWENVLKGQSGIGKITQFDTSGLDVHIAGEVPEFNMDEVISKKDSKRLDRFTCLSIMATEMALKDSGLELSEKVKSETGALIGVGMGGLPTIEATHKKTMEKGASRISPFFIPQVILNMAAGNISIRYGFEGPNYSVTSACASSLHSIGEAAEYIKRGVCNYMVAGGAESTVSELGIGGFAAMKALSKRNDSPTEASRPWDKDRDGFVLAEGAATLVLEEYELAKARGAKIYGEISGYGVSSDAHHMTNPSPGGKGAMKAMDMALKMAKINKEELEYVNAHGTSTPAGDLAETDALKALLGDSAKNIWVSSTKSMTGHGLGAAGAMESFFTLKTLSEGKVPPTINLQNPSEDCDLDYVPNEAREKNFKHVMNNSFGFGGTNACLVFSKI